MEFGWQGVVSRMWVIPWDCRVEDERVQKYLRYGELNLWVNGGGQVNFCVLLFFNLPWFLDIFNKGSSPAVTFPSSSKGTSYLQVLGTHCLRIQIDIFSFLKYKPEDYTPSRAALFITPSVWQLP